MNFIYGTFCRLIFKPKMFFIFKDKALNIYKRKKELTPGQIEEYNNVLLKKLNKQNYNYIIISVTNKKPKDVAKEVIINLLKNLGEDAFLLLKKELPKLSKNNKNNAVIIIPARGGSKRIKNKNILKLGNLTLIEHTILHALNSKLKKNIYISTDSTKIKLICKKYPVKVIDRPKKISNDYSSSEDALIHALDNIPFSPDYVVFLQCTSPFEI